MQLLLSLQQNQRGSVLVVGLFTLALLSLLGSAATTTSRTDVSITGNAKVLQEAFYAAEVSLTVAEMAVMNLESRDALSEHTIAGHYGPNDEYNWKSLEWDNTDSIEVAESEFPNGFTHMAALPRYTIQVSTTDRDSLVDGIGTRQGGYKFSIHAKGTGSSMKTEAILQSVIIRRFD